MDEKITNKQIGLFESQRRMLTQHVYDLWRGGEGEKVSESSVVRVALAEYFEKRGVPEV